MFFYFVEKKCDLLIYILTITLKFEVYLFYIFIRYCKYGKFVKYMTIYWSIVGLHDKTLISNYYFSYYLYIVVD